MHSQAQAPWHGVRRETGADSATPTFLPATSSQWALGTTVPSGCPCVNTHTAAYLAHRSGSTRKHRGIIPASYRLGFHPTSAPIKPPQWRQTPRGDLVSLITESFRCWQHRTHGKASPASSRADAQRKAGVALRQRGSL